MLFNVRKLLRSSVVKDQHRLSAGRSLVSFYDHRLLNAPVSCDTRFTEPLESWLSTMADAVPFTKNTFVVCPSTWDKLSMQNIQHRARKVFPAAQVGSVRRRENSTLLKRREDDSTQLVNSALPHSLARMPSTLNDVYQSPLDSLPSSSQDVVVFAGNILGQELWFQSPSHITAAHRVLRPHGVLAVFGHALEVKVVSPDWAAQDADDFLASLKQDEQSLLESQSQKGEQYKHDSLLSVKHRVDSMSCGHADIYFPFPAVQRRWFESEYSMSPTEIVACCRTLPTYNLCYGVKCQTCHLQRFGFDGKRNRVDDDFVDPTGWRENDCATVEGSVSLPSTGQLTVQRFLDPLDVLLKHWKWNHNIQVHERILRARVFHFVITCSRRGVNVIDSSSNYAKRMTRLPS